MMTESPDATLDGDDEPVAAGPALVVYHRDGVQVVPLEVGRTAPADVRPRSRRLSRRHARFERVADAVWVEDLGSTNGTFVNGERIVGRRAVVVGDEVTLGSVTVSVHAAGAAWVGP